MKSFVDSKKSDHSPYIIGICGGSGAGKTNFTNLLKRKFKDNLEIVCQDNYYKNLSRDICPSTVNFDASEALDMHLLYEHIKSLKENNAICQPTYDFITHSRKKESIVIKPKPIILIEGLLVFSDKKIRSVLDLKIFLDVSKDMLFIRKAERDFEERNRSYKEALEHYLKSVRDGYLKYILPSKRYADIVLPYNYPNSIGENIICSYIEKKICQKENEQLNEKNNLQFCGK